MIPQRDEQIRAALRSYRARGRLTRAQADDVARWLAAWSPEARRAHAWDYWGLMDDVDHAT
jgi:hypothetical protein